MSADVRTRAVELLGRLRGHGASLVVQLEPKDCAEAAGVLEALLQERDELELAAGKNRDSCIRLEEELGQARRVSFELRHQLEKLK